MKKPRGGGGGGGADTTTSSGARSSSRSSPRTARLARWLGSPRGPRASPQRWTVSVLALAATALAVLFLRGAPCADVLPDNRLPVPLEADDAALDYGRASARSDGAFATSANSEWLHPEHGGPRTLHFDVCNGFANQRLAVVYGAIAAKRLARAVVLPTLILDGTQSTDAPVLAGDVGAAPIAFEDFYDAPAVVAALSKLGVAAMTERQFREAAGDAIPTLVALSSSPSVDNLRGLVDMLPHARHVAVDCPLFKLGPDLVAEEEPLVWAVLEAMRPAERLGALAGRFAAELKGRPFNFLHLRVEKDWTKHCKRWSTMGDVYDGVVRDNCFNNTLMVDKVLKDRRFDPALPLYVAAHWPDVDPAIGDTALSRIRAAGFDVVRAPPSLEEEDDDGATGRRVRRRVPREVAALLEYELALRSERFLGNSVSTFSALAILERRRKQKWAGYYNGGDIPLDAFVPLFKVPWAFTFNSWSQGYELMLKAAVESANSVGGLEAHCVFAGDRSAPVVSWMERSGVRVIHHQPEWAPRLLPLANVSHLGESHLFKSNETVVATWQRIDVPLVPWLDQHTYVLFTDTDVLFARRFSFAEMPRPLPRSVGMGPEMMSSFPYNAGVMLAHLPELRATYDGFLAFILSNRKGLVFPGYGPGDQGAYNEFYEDDVRQWRLPAKFNAKPYHRAAPRRIEDVAIVHFHGPKPQLYLNFTAAGTCWEMNELCLKGFEARACVYLEWWARHADKAAGGGGGGQWRGLWDKTCPPWMKLQEKKAAEEAKEKAERSARRAELEAAQRQELQEQQQQQQPQHEQQL